MCNYSKQFINFNVNIDETVRYQCRNSALTMISDKEIFFIGECYFFYCYNRNENISTFSLREISKEEYRARKEDIFKLRPKGRFGRFSKGDNEYFIACYKNSVWKKNMPMSECILTSDSPLKKVFDAVRSEIEVREKVVKENEAFAKKEYARVCGALGSRLGISYVNVLRIGIKEEELIAFKNSYEEALEKIRKCSMAELRQLQIAIFKGTRMRRRKALMELGIKFFSADVMLMDWSLLEDVVEKPLKSYQEDSIKIAIDNAVDLPYNERMEVYNMLLNSNRNTKRAFLTRLGVEADAIDLSTYPMATIKRAIQNSLGIDNY